MADNANNVPPERGQVSRRRMLQASAGATALGLAGCFGGGGGSNGADGTFVTPINSSAGEVHYNPYNTGQYAGGL